MAQYIQYDLSSDGLSFQDPVFNRILSQAVERCAYPGFEAEPYFVHHDDVDISRLATQLSVDPYQLSASQKEASDDLDEDARILAEKTREEELRQQTLHLVLDFRMDYVEHHLKALQAAIAQSASQPERLMQLMTEYKDMQLIRNQLAKRLGNEIIT